MKRNSKPLSFLVILAMVITMAVPGTAFTVFAGDPDSPIVPGESEIYVVRNDTTIVWTGTEIQDAVTAASQDGDTILIGPGEYGIDSTVALTNKEIRVVGAGADETSINYNGSIQNKGMFSTPENSGLNGKISFSGIAFSNNFSGAHQSNYVFISMCATNANEASFYECSFNNFYTVAYFNNTKAGEPNNNKISIRNCDINNTKWVFSQDDITAGSRPINEDDNVKLSGNTGDDSENNGQEVFGGIKVRDTVTGQSRIWPTANIQAAVTAALDGDTIYVPAGTYELPSQIRITKALNIIGSGDATVITKGTANWSNTSGSKGYAPLIAIHSGDNAVRLQDLTVTGARTIIMTVLGAGTKDNGSGINVVNSSNVILENITSMDNDAAGLIVNSSTVSAINLNTSGNGKDGSNNWYGVNVDKGSGGGNAHFTLTGNGVIDDPVQIKSDNRNNVTVNADGYKEYPLEGSTVTIWHKGEISNIASISDGTETKYYATIQAAINAATSGDAIYVAPGTYNESLTVDRPITIEGAGKDLTIISGSAVTLKATGTADKPLKFKNLQIQGGDGFRLTSSSPPVVDYLTLDSVKVKGLATTGDYYGIKLKQELNSSLKHLTITGSSIENFEIGILLERNSGNPNINEHFSITNTTISGNRWKGVYVESLSDATFTNVQVLDNGVVRTPGYPAEKQVAGIDINLKYGAYHDLTFDNLTVTGNGKGAAEGAGMMIKARDDSGYAATPAALTNVIINGGTFTGNERGIRIGEPGQNNTGPAIVTIHNAVISGNNKTYGGMDGSTYGAVINLTRGTVDASRNWWGTADANAISGMVVGAVAFSPWYTSAAMNNPIESNPVTVSGSGISFGTIQDAISAPTTKAGDTIIVAAGDYKENVIINKSIHLISCSGAAMTKIIATDASKEALKFATNNATVSGFTLTHEYPSDEFSNWSNWNDTYLARNKGADFGQTTSGNTLKDCIVTLNINGVYLNHSGTGNKIINNTITNNWTGISLVNDVNGTEITGNTISNNWTFGLVYYHLSVPGDLSAVTVNGNTFEQNWYSEIVVKNTAGTIGTLDVSNNTFKDLPVTYSISTSSALNEPALADLIPKVPGIDGTAVKPSIDIPTLRVYNNSSAGLKYDKPKTLTVGPEEYTTIQAAINAATTGDAINVAAGTYNESLTINKPVTIIGAGTDNNDAIGTIIKGVKSPTVALSASGADTDHPVMFKDLQIRAATSTSYGFKVTANIENIALENIYLNALEGGGSVGFYVGTDSTIKHLRIRDSVFEGFSYGIYFAEDNPNIIHENKNEDITIEDTVFQNNLQKGFYAENLSDSVFNNVSFINNALAGISINLLLNNYKNLTFNDLTVTGNGLGDTVKGVGMMIKARTDGSYSTTPAALQGVTINRGTFTDNERGINFGESETSYDGVTNAAIHNAKIFNNTHGDLINLTGHPVNATNNYWGATAPDVSGNVEYFPWYVDAGKTRLINEGYNLTATSKTNNTITLSWNETPSVDGYTIYNGTKKVNASPITGTSITVTGLGSSTTYSNFILSIWVGDKEYVINEPSPVVTTYSSGGGGGGNTTPPPTPPAPPALQNPVTPDDQKLISSVTSTGTASLDLSGSTNATAGLSTSIVTQLAQENIPLKVENKGVELSFAPASLVTPELQAVLSQTGATVEIGAKAVTEAEKAEIIASANLGASTGIFEVGGVIVDLSANVVAGGTTTKIEEFSEPVAVTIDLSGLNLTPEQISELSGVRYEKDAEGNIVPVPLGGTYDSVTKTFTFYTSKFSLYSVVQVPNLTTIELLIENNVTKVNGADTNIDVPPYLVNGSTMVPLRFIGEALGADFVWDGTTRTVTFTLDGKELKLVIDQLVPGMNVPAILVNSRTLVPVRYITEAFGAEVSWFPTERKVLIVK
jgi:parallel beta-helix repeat protein